MRLGIILVGLFFFQYLQLSEAVARESSSITFGGGGGTRSYNLDCGSGGVIVGGDSTGYSHMDQMIVHCRTMNANGTLLEEKYTRGPVGGMGGHQAGRADCQAGRVVTGFQVEAPGFVNLIEFLCEAWDASRQEPVFEDSPFRTLIGRSCLGCVRKQYRTFRCPRGKVAKALRGKSGIYIDSVRLVCDDWNR